MNNACRIHYCFCYFVPRPITATPSHAGHTVHPQILYINVSTLHDESCLRPGLDVPSSVNFKVSHLMLQSKYDTKYIALLLIASHAKRQRKIAATADKKPRARYSDKDEH